MWLLATLDRADLEKDTQERGSLMVVPFLETGMGKQEVDLRETYFSLFTILFLLNFAPCTCTTSLKKSTFPKINIYLLINVQTKHK